MAIFEERAAEEEGDEDGNGDHGEGGAEGEAAAESGEYGAGIARVANDGVRSAGDGRLAAVGLNADDGGIEGIASMAQRTTARARSVANTTGDRDGQRKLRPTVAGVEAGDGPLRDHHEQTQRLREAVLVSLFGTKALAKEAFACDSSQDDAKKYERS